MTDAQHFFDLVGIIEASEHRKLTYRAQARQTVNEVANSLESHFEVVADQLREFLPNQLLRSPPPPPPRRLTPATTLQVVQRWISQNSALAAGIGCFVGTGAVLLFIQRRSHLKRRRAKRTSGGARTEVVGMFWPEDQSSHAYADKLFSHRRISQLALHHCYRARSGTPRIHRLCCY